MRFSVILFFVIFFLGSGLLFSVDQRSELARELTSHMITAGDYQNSIDYATAVDICGDWLIIGAPLDDEIAPDAGSAYIYQWNGSSWSNEHKLYASDAEENDQFGCSVAISGDMALVGAMYEDTRANNAGAVYAYYYNGADWIEQKLMASDGEANNRFGICLDFDADTAVIGAPYRSETGNSSGVIYTFTRSGNSWTQDEKLYPADGNVYDYFGFSVSISGNWIAAGSTGNDQAGNVSGAVYFYQNSGSNWLEKEKVIASDTQEGDEFGNAVDIYGDYALLAAWKDDDNGPNSGSAYIFKRIGESWIEQDKLLASDGATSDYFGNSASLDGDYAVVGAALDDSDGVTNCGSAYVFKRNNAEWDQIEILTATEQNPDDLFGTQVAISGNTIAVGCPGDDDNGIDAGSVSSFLNTDDVFSLSGKTMASDGYAYRYFGSALDMDGNWLVVGVPFDNDLGEEAGAVYVYHWSGSEWQEISKFSGSDTQAGDQFGISVAIDGTDFLVGAWHEDTRANNAGAAYFFAYDGSTWQQQKLMAPDGLAHDHFGYSVSFDNGLAAFGAPGSSDNGSQSGAVYYSEHSGTNWQNPVKYVPADNTLYDYFGTSVAVSNTRIIVGAPGVDDYGNGSGAAYIYDTTALTEDKIFAPDIADNDNFGKVVALSGNNALVSSINDDDNGPNSGSAHLFNYNGTAWIHQQKLVPSSLQSHDYFGSALALSSDYAAVASTHHSNSGEQEGGTVYIYPRDSDSWNILVDLSLTEPADYDWFGKAVAISGNQVACGWPGNDDNGIDTGAVMIYHDLDSMMPLYTPADLVINVTDTGVSIFFTAVSGATGYKVYAASSVEGSYSEVTGSGSFSQNGNTICWSSPVLENNQFFRLIAVQAGE